MYICMYLHMYVICINVHCLCYCLSSGNGVLVSERASPVDIKKQQKLNEEVSKNPWTRPVYVRSMDTVKPH